MTNNNDKKNNLNSDDVRLTAWILNELDENEAREVETALADNPELNVQVDELRDLIGTLSTALKNEPVEANDPNEPASQSSEVESDKSIATVKGTEKRSRSIRIVMTVAALLLLGVTAVYFFQENKRESRQIAQKCVDEIQLSTLSEPKAPESMRTDSMRTDSMPPQVAKPISIPSQNAMPIVATAPVGMNKMENQVSESTILFSDKASVERKEAFANNDRKFHAYERQLDRSENTGRMAPMKSRMAPMKSRRTDRDALAPNSPNTVIKNRPDYTSRDSEEYKKIQDKPFVTPKEEPFSTFSIDVDTASWSNIRRYLNAGHLPPADAVKVEEIVNYFRYDYQAPKEDSKDPFAVNTDVAPCPWAEKHLLVRIGLKGREIKMENRPPMRLVFLIDVSGSMSSENKLPLVKKALMELTEQLTDKDRLAIVVYASRSGIHLDSVSGSETARINHSIEELNAGGSTAGAEGLRTAYEVARKHFDKGSVNRIILCSDGDFNVGMTNNDELEKTIEKEAKSGVFLSVLGFGMGNYKDSRMASLSNKGNGNYAYIDTLDEARRVLVKNFAGTIVTIAKDVKIQVDFNPARVAGYRLLGYDDRRLAAADFNNDKKDAGEIGAGHTVTALYEIVPVGVELPGIDRIDESRYATDEKKKEVDSKAENKADVKNDKSEKSAEFKEELMFVKLRYKLPDEKTSKLISTPIVFGKDTKSKMSSEFKFAAAAALFAQLLRESSFTEDSTMNDVLKLANEGVKEDKDRQEFVKLVKRTIEIQDR